MLGWLMARMYRPRPGIAGPALAVRINPQADWEAISADSTVRIRRTVDPGPVVGAHLSGEVTRVGR